MANHPLPFWLPIALSIPLTVILFLLAAAPCGVGHGNCRLFVLFFPTAMLPELLGLMNMMPKSVFIIGSVQFPLYAVILTIANRKGHTKPAALILLVLHASLAVTGYLS